ncbi:MAG TPA: methylated-DNA--[protein]-cysteine S-methyltransferase [Gemmatimonadales bacterium]|jgi:AraC family transcriptional regulator of adaptative response/methylated-DNA-[protein]-cysteine methyltransferase|nr:methylated-DNA--[protein]-cysteine S-methyltransferase [Gemmatimonadales bacterium]
MSPTERWQAVLARDRRFDGAFVYAVRSTGIYCRPSCASRRPRRTQVTFFPIPEAAEREGFRACRRCHPAAANGSDPAVALVREACRAIAAGEPYLGDSRRLARAFKRVLGITPRAYAEARRVARFKQELKRRQHVSPALYEAGYSSTSRVYERTHEQLGMTPARYARGGAGVGIAYFTVPTSLGRLLVAATERGVCRVALADNAGILEQDLLAEFPNARVVEDKSGKLHGWVRSILAYLDGHEPDLDLPLDIRATAFQRRVWQELQKIPFGQTRTYAEVARRIGRPTAVRAVANACANNPVALVIPCHRVVSQSGETGGYRWGIERKKALLERERDGEVDA